MRSETTSSIVEQAIETLEDARARTLELIAPCSEEDLTIQHDPLMSPIVWDLGHIAHFEALWLGQNLDGPIRFVEMPGVYNPFEHPRRERGALGLPSAAATLATMAEIRHQVLARLETLEVDDGNPLLRDGYVFAMVAQHEYQHNETILQTLQLKTGAPYAAVRRVSLPNAGPSIAGEMVRVPGGEVAIGTDDRAVAYDNERPRHVVTLPPFRMDATPVTNGDYLRFMDDGGYSRQSLWSEAAWAWLQDARVDAPKYWSRDGRGWNARVMDSVAPVDEARPVCHVSWYEAEAFACWASKRLPTELEWEAAASWDPGTGVKHDWPWGDGPPTPADANLDQLAFGTAPVGAYSRNVSPVGCYGMIGDVWEWTSSDFAGYPGYESFPYPEYSEVFFGTEYKVLRGGSWATRPGAIRNTFRNWDYPIRRQIFAGFRCAADD